MQILTYSILLSAVIAFYIWFYRSIYGKRINVDLSAQMIYGWYDDNIMISKSFSRDLPNDSILEIKRLLEKELDEMIEKYKQVNK